MRSTLILGGVFLACLLCGCTDDAKGDDQDNRGWDIGTGGDADATTDVGGADIGHDTNLPDGGTEAFEVTFELVNESGRPIYAYPQVAGTSGCDRPGRHWLSVDQGAQLVDDCQICNCDEGDDCSVCVYDCPGPATRDVSEVADGMSRSFVWDGHFWQMSAETCESSELADDRQMEAKFCWGFAFDDASNQVSDLRCMPVDFRLESPEQVVRVTVPARETHDITFRMINATGNDLYASPGGATQGFGCYGSWYSVGNGDESYSVASTCGICACSEVEANPGEQCQEACPGGACPAPTEEAYRFADGAELSDTWSGKIWVQDEVASQSCERLSDPPLDRLVATLCFAEEVDTSGTYATLGPTTCQQISFDRLADDEIVLRLE